MQIQARTGTADQSSPFSLASLPLPFTSPAANPTSPPAPAPSSSPGPTRGFAPPAILEAFYRARTRARARGRGERRWRRQPPSANFSILQARRVRRAYIRTRTCPVRLHAPAHKPAKKGGGGRRRGGGRGAHFYRLSRARQPLRARLGARARAGERERKRASP